MSFIYFYFRFWFELDQKIKHQISSKRITTRSGIWRQKWKSPLAPTPQSQPHWLCQSPELPWRRSTDAWQLHHFSNTCSECGWNACRDFFFSRNKRTTNGKRYSCYLAEKINGQLWGHSENAFSHLQDNSMNHPESAIPSAKRKISLPQSTMLVSSSHAHVCKTKCTSSWKPLPQENSQQMERSNPIQPHHFKFTWESQEEGCSKHSVLYS